MPDGYCSQRCVILATAVSSLRVVSTSAFQIRYLPESSTRFDAANNYRSNNIGCLPSIYTIYEWFKIFNTNFSRSELFVDDPGREGRIKVQLNVSLPYLSCEYIGVDIQDDNGRHEVGFVQNTEKIPIGTDGCRFEAKFEIRKVPGNFHLSTHAAQTQPEKYDMRHQIHSVAFGDDIVKGSQHLGSFNPLKDREDLQTDGTFTHDYVLKIVPSVYEDINGNSKYSYQYTYAHKSYVSYHYSGKVIPAVWFRYELQPITVKYTEIRQPFYTFITSICAVVGGTFTVAGIIDSLLFSLTELYRKHQIGKLS